MKFFYRLVYFIYNKHKESQKLHIFRIFEKFLLILHLVKTAQLRASSYSKTA